MRCASLVIQGEKIARYSQHDFYFLYSIIHAHSRPSSLRPYFLLLLSHYHLVKIFSFLSCSGLSGSSGRYAMFIQLSYSNQVVWVLHSFFLPPREFLFSLSHIYRSPRPVIECSFIIFLRRNSPVLSFLFFLLFFFACIYLSTWQPRACLKTVCMLSGTIIKTRKAVGN